ncbi:hypothetical protein [Methylobacterium pseudosasicola]|uniref:Uncharacterized protein n=1 Tax=Methylobacterium pseudosasicola TaxID=582667 RepID=A0A1I4VGQ0_9HYPH|nr:hypothetical protein [Methylobacterium pseudosasicola]SFN00424.1 hypothetical protein SAMN05192568_11007 [Methylobacterium pseudosasicola]
MTLRTSLQRLIGRDPARLSLRERAAETAARLAASKPAADAATADPPTLADAALTVAAADLQRVEATIAAIPTAPGQDLDDVLGYGILDAAADRAADVLTNTPADSLIGLQAKAAAILSDRFSVPSPEALEMAHSLARDVLNVQPVEQRPLPAPDSPEALTQFEAACREHTRRTEFANGYPDLKRTVLEWWTQDNLRKALEAGEIDPAECARLLRMASERELRMAQVEHDLDLGPLEILAFAGAHGTPPGVEEEPTDPIFELIDAHHAAFCTWDTAASAAGNAHPSDPGLQEARKATIPLLHAQESAFMALVGSLPASLSGLMALTDYLPTALALRGSHEADDEAALTVGGLCASIRKLVAERKVTAAPGAEPTDWYSPSPGFMASPAIEPTHFALIPHALRVELDRLHCIAVREFERQVRPDTAPELRERLRRLLKIDIFEAASLSGDAQILVLGMELDAVHTRWRASLPAHNEAQARFSWAEQDAKAQGKDVWAAHEAVWDEPGVREAIGLFEDICAELDPICRKIWATPARTPLGLAVKARASLVMIFACGEYEAGRDLGENEDLTEQSARHLIEACCAFAGVNWKGELLDGSQLTAPVASQDRPTPGLVGMVDFAAASLDELQSLRDLADQVGGVAYATMWTGRCKGRGGHYNAVGELTQWLGDALTDVETAAFDEARRRRPTTHADRETRLKMLARPVIQNGDPDEIAAFAGELAAHSLAELQGR